MALDQTESIHSSKASLIDKMKQLTTEDDDLQSMSPSIVCKEVGTSLRTQSS